MSIYRETVIQRSRMPHRCECCRTNIPVGSSYTSVTGQWDDGRPYTYAAHSDCLAWEHFLHQESGNYPDEYMHLYEHVENTGMEVLDGAPEEVRARFNIEDPQ